MGDGPVGEENIPWLEYESTQLAKNVSAQALELPSDGPPGTLNVVFSQLKPSRDSRKEAARGSVVCGSGCYECVEGPSCLYNKLASTLPQMGISVLQLAYRPPGNDE